MLVLALFAQTGLILPQVVIGLAGKAGIFTIIIGALLGLIFAAFLWMLCKKYSGSYLDYSKDCLGQGLGKLYIGIYLVKYVVSAAFMLSIFTQILNYAFLTETPAYIVGAAMLIVVTYGAVKGVEVRARLSELLFYVVVLPVIILLLLAVPQVRPERLFPLEIVSDGSLMACAVVFAFFTLVEWVLFLGPSIKHEKRGKRQLVWSILLPALVLIGLTGVCIGIFSAPGTLNETWPIVKLMQIARLPGGFISRQDGLLIAFWIVAVFMLLDGYIFHITDNLTQLFPKKKGKWWMVLFPSVIVYILFLCLQSWDVMPAYLHYMLWIVLPQSVIFPVILWIAGKIKGGRSR